MFVWNPYATSWDDYFRYFGVPLLQSDEQEDRAQLFTLVTKPKHAPHLFGATIMVTACIADDGLERHERTCAVCSLARLTMIAPSWVKKNTPPAWREYRDSEGQTFLADIEPGCPGVTIAERKAS